MRPGTDCDEGQKGDPRDRQLVGTAGDKQGNPGSAATRQPGGAPTASPAAKRPQIKGRETKAVPGKAPRPAQSRRGSEPERKRTRPDCTLSLALPNETGSALLRASERTSHTTGTGTLPHEAGWPISNKSGNAFFLSQNQGPRERGQARPVPAAPLRRPPRAVPATICGDHFAVSEHNSHVWGGPLSLISEEKVGRYTTLLSAKEERKAAMVAKDANSYRSSLTRARSPGQLAGDPAAVLCRHRGRGQWLRSDVGGLIRHRGGTNNRKNYSMRELK